MSRSLPIKAEVTVMDPVRSAPIAIAIVAVNTNSTSCTVELKQGGRILFVCTSPIGSMSVGFSDMLGTIGLDWPEVWTVFSSAMLQKAVSTEIEVAT